MYPVFLEVASDSWSGFWRYQTHRRDQQGQSLLPGFSIPGQEMHSSSSYKAQVLHLGSGSPCSGAWLPMPTAPGLSGLPGAGGELCTLTSLAGLPWERYFWQIPSLKSEKDLECQWSKSPVGCLKARIPCICSQCSCVLFDMSELINHIFGIWSIWIWIFLLDVLVAIEPCQQRAGASATSFGAGASSSGAGALDP